MLRICFTCSDFCYFVIKYDVEFDNLLIIIFLPQIYLMSILLFIFYDKSNIRFFYQLSC